MKQASVKFIFVTILLDAIGLGLLIPVFPDIMRRFTQDPTAVGRYFGLFMSIYALMQFLASPILGSLSDRFGRRSILLTSLIGAALDYLFMAFASSLGLLFIGRVISGLTGASMTVASSYMADISDDKNRSSNFGMIGAAWGMGFIFGPLLGGVVSSFGYQAPFLLAASLNLLNFIFGIFVLPESLPAHSRRKIELKNLNPFKSLYKALRPSSIALLIWIFFILFLAGQVHPSTWTLYTEHKFGWSSFQVGLSLSFVGFAIALAQGGLTRIVIPRFGEQKSLFLGLGVYIVGFFLFGVATQGWMMYAIMAFFALSGVAVPALQSMVSKKTPSNEQGELQGTMVSLGSLAAIISPLLFTGLFTHFTRPESALYLPGASYIGASLICVFAWLLFFRAAKDYEEHKK